MTCPVTTYESSLGISGSNVVFPIDLTVATLDAVSVAVVCVNTRLYQVPDGAPGTKSERVRERERVCVCVREREGGRAKEKESE